jgi:hypothetical protein
LKKAEEPSLERKREKLFDLNAVPAKEILKNKAQVCPPLSAICEIMDNIFDNFEENGSRHDLTISIIATTSGTDSRISIAENSGGVRAEKLEPLVRLGVPYHGAKGSIGTWGEGLKVAAFSLGREVEILTSFPGEPSVAIHFDEHWLNSPDWRVPVYDPGPEAPSPGCTIFGIRALERRIDWADIMRELAVIYGHKITRVEERGKRVRLEVEVDGSRTRVKPRALASIEALRQRLAFPPDFSPRVFQNEWDGQHGTVRCHLTIGLTARHSGETSGVYLYGNGRLFARALRTRAVGYGESGNSVLRDHPSCWRIHAYAFFDADDGADIPWQAPLKDGISENHPITAAFRQMFKDAVAPYSRFAKVAKASELVPYTAEWHDMVPSQKADTLFGKQTDDALQRFNRLPRGVQKFEPPPELESLNYAGVACETMLTQLEDHARYARKVIAKRDAEGPALQEDVLRALNPRPFSDEKPQRQKFDGPQRTDFVRLPRTTRVTVELRDVQLMQLREIFSVSDNKEAIIEAVRHALKTLADRGMRRSPGKAR